MTVDELMERMTGAEYAHWIAYMQRHPKTPLL